MNYIVSVLIINIENIPYGETFYEYGILINNVILGMYAINAFFVVISLFKGATSAAALSLQVSRTS